MIVMHEKELNMKFEKDAKLNFFNISMLKWLVVEGMSNFQLSDESKKSKFIWLPVNLRWFYPLGGKRVFVLQS